MTEVEQFLFVSRGAHAVTGIALLPNRVTIQIAPWENMPTIVEAVFDHAKLIHIWASTDATPEDIALPWDIIGFDSYAQKDGQWHFVLNCRSVELSFLAAWPHVIRNSR